MTMRTLTDTDMLTAARRALARHLASRPARAEELIAQAESLEARALDLLRETLPPIPSISDLILPGERGRHVLGMQHELAGLANDRCKQALHASAAAYSLRLRADACRRAAALGDGVAWEATRQDLCDRVSYYAARVAEATD